MIIEKHRNYKQKIYVPGNHKIIFYAPFYYVIMVVFRKSTINKLLCYIQFMKSYFLFYDQHHIILGNVISCNDGDKNSFMELK